MRRRAGQGDRCFSARCRRARTPCDGLPRRRLQPSAYDANTRRLPLAARAVASSMIRSMSATTRGAGSSPRGTLRRPRHPLRRSMIPDLRGVPSSRRPPSRPRNPLAGPPLQRLHAPHVYEIRSARLSITLCGRDSGVLTAVARRTGQRAIGQPEVLVESCAHFFARTAACGGLECVHRIVERWLLVGGRQARDQCDRASRLELPSRPWRCPGGGVAASMSPPTTSCARHRYEPGSQIS